MTEVFISESFTFGDVISSPGLQKEFGDTGTLAEELVLLKNGEFPWFPPFDINTDFHLYTCFFGDPGFGQQELHVDYGADYPQINATIIDPEGNPASEINDATAITFDVGLGAGPGVSRGVTVVDGLLRFSWAAGTLEPGIYQARFTLDYRATPSGTFDGLSVPTVPIKVRVS